MSIFDEMMGSLFFILFLNKHLFERIPFNSQCKDCQVLRTLTSFVFFNSHNGPNTSFILLRIRYAGTIIIIIIIGE